MFHNVSPSEYSIWSLVGNLDLEGESVSNPDSLHLLLSGVKDPNPGGGGLGGGGDADHVRVPDGHHAEGDVLAARVVCTSDLRGREKLVVLLIVNLMRDLYLVDFVSLGHHDAVPLNYHCVGVNSALEIFRIDYLLSI